MLKANANYSHYIGLSSYIAKTKELEVIANNLSNAKTNGYESDGMTFSSMNKSSKFYKYSFVKVDKLFSSESKGSIQTTKNPLDLAILSEGYFKVLINEGYRYTLDGAISISNENVLVNQMGLPFLSRDDQPIILPESYNKINITQDGSIYVDQENIGSIGVFTFAKSGGLIKEGGNLYISQEDDILLENPFITQGVLRGSNVSSAKEMMRLNNVQRSAEMVNSIIHTVNEMDKVLINKLLIE